MAATLRDFLHDLEAAGELHRVRRTVSPRLEIAAIADRHAKALAPSRSASAAAFDPLHADRGGRALLFESVEGCDLPLAINVFGSYRRMEMALGVAESGGFAAIAARLASLTKPEPPRNLAAIVAKGREMLPLLRTPPRRVRQGVCQEVVRRTEKGEVDLRRLPLIQCWPLDGDPAAVGYPLTAEAAGTAGGHGRYITFAGMHTIHARDARVNKPSSHNIGMYRGQLVGPTRLVMHWHVHHDGAAHWRSWRDAKMPMPIAICFGGESVLPYAATAPLPPGISELLMAGFLNGRGIPLVRAKTVPLRVPANSEVVIEGFVRTDAGVIGFDPRRDPGGLGPGAAFEGPFGDHTGYYSLPDRYPLVDVTAVTHRHDAIFPATIVGRPPQEDYYLGKATERIFLPLLKTLIPDIEDYHLPLFGCFHNCAFIAIDKAYPLQARRVMHAVWGAGQMAWTKMIVVVDADVDVHDEAAVLRAMFTRCHFGRDVETVNGPLDILDHAAPRLGAGHKIGFDATRRMTGEEVGGYDLSAPAPGDRDAIASRLEPLVGSNGLVRIAVPELGGGRAVFAAVRKTAVGQGASAIDRIFAATAEGADFVVVVDDDANVGDWSDTFFHLCANADPGRDVHMRGPRLAFDATRKLPGDERNGQPVRDYPPIIRMTEEVRERVETHRGEFGL